MDRSLILETTFLIDFERERRSGGGTALEFLKGRADHRLCITHTIAGELAGGTSLANGERWEAFIAPFRMLKWDKRVDWQYGRIFRYLKSQGRLIGANDLWIAATAIRYGCPVVSANTEHFRRVPDLEFLEYRRSQ